MQKINLYSSAYGNYQLAIVGESSYQYEIKSIADCEEGSKSDYREDGFTAELFFEDNNPHDRGNAIRVDIDNKTVGYLSRSDAKKYREGLSRQGLKNVVGTCYAAISGRYNNETEDLLFGVFLDLDVDRLVVLNNSTPAKPSTKQAKLPATSQTKEKKPFIQTIIDTWNKGLVEKVVLIILALAILNFIFRVWQESSGY